MKAIYLEGTKSVFELNIYETANKELDQIEEKELELENVSAQGRNTPNQQKTFQTKTSARFGGGSIEMSPARTYDATSIMSDERGGKPFQVTPSRGRRNDSQMLGSKGTVT